MGNRIEGQEISPRDVKKGDKIRVSLRESDGMTLSYTGVVGSLRRNGDEDTVFWTECGRTYGPCLYSSRWGTVTKVELLEKAVEPHPMEDAKAGDWFFIEGDYFGRTWTYTKLRDGVWVIERRNSDSEEVMDVSPVSESKARATFTNCKAELHKA